MLHCNVHVYSFISNNLLTESTASACSSHPDTQAGEFISVQTAQGQAPGQTDQPGSYTDSSRTTVELLSARPQHSRCGCCCHRHHHPSLVYNWNERCMHLDKPARALWGPFVYLGVVCLYICVTVNSGL